MIDLNQVNVIDNFIPLNFQNYLYNICSNNTNWHLISLEGETTFLDKKERSIYIDENNTIKDNIHESFQFSNSVMDANRNIFNISLSSQFHLLHYLQILLDFKYNLIPLRVKANLQTPSLYSNKNFHNSPHIDVSPNPNTFTLIYYVNDSDGDTVVFNEKYEGSPIKTFSINKKISPKKGRMVMFPSPHFHCGSHPINSTTRIVINCNFQLIPL